MLSRLARKYVYTILISSVSTEVHSKGVKLVNNKIYIFGSKALNIAHVRRKGVDNGEVTLKLGLCVRVGYLHMCAEFCDCCQENPDRGFRFCNQNLSISSFSEFKSCFSTSVFQSDFLCLLLTGAYEKHIQTKVFFSHSTYAIIVLLPKHALV